MRQFRRNGIALYVDHTSRFPYNTGIQRCVRAVARALMESGVPLQPLVWNRVTSDFSLATPSQRRHLGSFGGPDPCGWCDHIAPVWLLVIELVRGDQNPDPPALLVASASRGLKVAWIVHDTLPLRWDPEPVRSDHERYLRGLSLFDLVLANSRSTAADLKQFFLSWNSVVPPIIALPLAEELPPVRLDEGISHRRFDQQDLSLMDGVVILCVASLEPRKNHRNFLKAVAWLDAQQRYPAITVLVGWPHDPRVVSMVKRVQKLGLPVLWFHGIEDFQLAALNRRADICVFPSLEEGFGLPVAEALQHGKPCLCSNAGALGELAAGGGCLTVDTANWRQLSQALGCLLGEPKLRAKLSQQARQRPQRSWHCYAEELMALLNDFGLSRL
jgi:glycosyltransferase involved in cell wall biosynthesis